MPFSLRVGEIVPQLREVVLWIDVVAASGTGEGRGRHTRFRQEFLLSFLLISVEKNRFSGDTAWKPTF